MLKKTLIWIHRWLTLLLLPLFTVIIITGAILSLEPIVKDVASGPVADAPLEVETLTGFLESVDPRGHSRSVHLEHPDTVVIEFSRRQQREVFAYELTSGRLLEERTVGAGFFRTVRLLHKHLMLDLAIVVEAATYALVLVIIIGPLLAWPRLRQTLLGWHTVLGWVAFPLVLMVPLTGILMTLNLGTPGLPPIDREQRPLPLAVAIGRVAEQAGISQVYEAVRVRRAAVAVRGRADGEERTYVVTRGGVTRIDAYPGLVTQLHQGTWAGGWSGALNLITSLILALLMVTGLLSWERRRFQSRRRTGDADANILVAWASQTGTAARLAQATADALRAGGARVQSASLAGLSPHELTRFRRVFLLASTAGDGQVPEPARRFLKELEGADLKGCPFAMLALGDSSYTHFCAGGLTLRAALREAGAEECLPLVKADRDPAEPWAQWLGAVAAHLGVTAGAVDTPRGDQLVTLTLRYREQLNDPNDPDTNEVWSLLWQSREPLAFRPGDLLLVSPGEGEPGRPYSIGSTADADPCRILLTVALTTREDEAGQTGWGKASGLLCRQVTVGDTLRAALRAHPDFNPPSDPERPMIMIAAGCGIAPFMGFMEEQAHGQRSGPAWLIFGNRKRGGDFFYGSKLEAWHRDGILDRLDTAFSRDPDGGGYVQDRMIAQRAELLDWLLDRGAILYACGKANTVGEGVRSALLRILLEAGGRSENEASRQLQRWEADGTLRFDLID